MSRSNYTDDLPGPELNLYRSAVDSAIRGTRGQTFLRELVTALDTMPVKELHSELLAESDGRVCAMGAVAMARGISVASVDPDEPGQVALALDIAKSMAREIAYENDEGAGSGYSEEPEDRWYRMRRWASNQIRNPVSTQRGTCSWCMRQFSVRRGVMNRHNYNGAKCLGVGLGPLRGHG